VDGVGKTHTTTVIIEELANKTNYPIVIFDQNNEYSTINLPVSPNPSSPFNFKTLLVNSNDARSSQDLVTKKIKQGEVIVVTAENLAASEKTDYYSNILKVLAKSSREKNAPPFLLVIEEAENLKLQAIEEILSTKDGISTIFITSTQQC